MSRQNLFTLTVFLVLTASLIYCFKNWRFVDHQGSHCVASDGRGYYAYLPAVFIYHDLSFDFIKQTEKNLEAPENIGGFLSITKEGKVNKYFSGSALLMSPFFLISLAFSRILGYAPDGYSGIFQLFVCVASAFYFLLGLFFVRKTLKLFDIGEVTAALTVLLIGFGTNLFYYCVMEPSMSHVYSFFAVSLFLYHVKRYILFAQKSSLMIAALALGIITLIRPPNFMICGIIPFLAGSPEILFNRMRNFIGSKSGFVFSILIVCVVISIQIILWKIQTGHFFVWSYPGEQFYFLRPEIMNVLFSFRKGLFVYTPMTLLALTGLIFIYKRSRFGFFSFIIFLSTITYVLSCWWSWWYGGSFGLRAFIDYYAVFAIPLGLSIDAGKNITFRISVLVFGFVLLWVSLIQSYQYTFNILKWDLMSKKDYFEVFLSTKNRHRGYLNREIITLDSSTVSASHMITEDFEKPDSLHPDFYQNEKVFRGKFAGMADEKQWFSKTLSVRLSDITSSKNVWIKVCCMANLENLRSDAQLVISIEKNGKASDWRSIMLNEFINEKQIWKEACYENRLPSFDADDTLKVYVLCTKKKVFTDDIEVRLFDLKK